MSGTSAEKKKKKTSVALCDRTVGAGFIRRYLNSHTQWLMLIIGWDLHWGSQLEYPQVAVHALASLQHGSHRVVFLLHYFRAPKVSVPREPSGNCILI